MTLLYAYLVQGQQDLLRAAASTRRFDRPARPGHRRRALTMRAH
ncbi:MAG: hypothetical protein ACXVGD_15880 [Blastococcus sp.]